MELTGIRKRFEEREAFQNVQIVFDSITITNADIVDHAFKISRSCGSGQVGFGNAEAAELEFTLNNYSGKYDEITLTGKECTVYLYLGQPTQSTENRITLGHFTVDTSNRTKESISISALDRMVRFDRAVLWTDIPETISVKNLINKCCSTCGVLLPASITGLPNLEYVVTKADIPDKDNMTYRELLKNCLEICCSNAVIDETGALRLVKYTDEPVYQLRDTCTYKYEHSDEPLMIDGFVYKDGDYKNTTEYVSGVADGHIIDFSNNPLIHGDPSELLAACKSYWTGLDDLYSFNASVEPIPWILPGAIVNVKKYDGTVVKSFLTSVEISLNRSTSIANTCENYQIGHASGSGISAQQIRTLKQIESQTSQAKAEAEQSALHFTEMIANGIGLKHTVIDGKDYWFDGEDINHSSIVYTMNSNGFAWTKDYQGANTTWVYGVDKDGNAILNYLTVNKLTADQITAGSISADLLSTQYKNSVETKFDDYLLKKDYETGIEQTKDDILLYVQEHGMSMPNNNLIINSYHPQNTKGLLATCELITDPYATDEWARNAFKIHQTSDGTNDSLYTSNRFALDHNDDTYTLSFYLGKTINVKSLKVTLGLSNSVKSTGTETTTELVNTITPIQGKAGERIEIHFNDSTELNHVFGGVTYNKFTTLMKTLLIVSGYIKIEVGERILTTGEGYVYLDGVKLEKGDSATSIIASPNEVSDIYSQINIEKDQILLQVKSDSKVNPNLIKNSYHPTSKNELLESDCTVVNDPYNVDSNARYGFKIENSQVYRSNRFSLEKDTPYTLSYKLRKAENVFSIGAYLRCSTPDNVDGTNYDDLYTLSHYVELAPPQEINYTYEYVGFINDVKNKNYTNAYLEIKIFKNDNSLDGYAIIDEIKFEAGDKATPYTANMSESSITIDNEQILLQVKKEVMVNPNLLVCSKDPKNSDMFVANHVIEDYTKDGVSGRGVLARTKNGTANAWIRMNRFDVDKTKDYTLSFDIIEQTNVTSIKMGLFMSDDIDVTGSRYTHGFYNVVPVSDLQQTSDGRYYHVFRWSDFNSSGLYNNSKSAFITIRVENSNNEECRLLCNSLKFEEGVVPTKWVEGSVGSQGTIQSLIRVTSGSIDLQAEAIRMQATKLTWDATNSSLDADGILTAYKGVFNEATLQQCDIVDGSIYITCSFDDAYSTTVDSNGFSISSRGQGNAYAAEYRWLTIGDGSSVEGTKLYSRKAMQIVCRDFYMFRNGYACGKGYTGTKNGIRFINGIAVE